MIFCKVYIATEERLVNPNISANIKSGLRATFNLYTKKRNLYAHTARRKNNTFTCKLAGGHVRIDHIHVSNLCHFHKSVFLACFENSWYAI